MSNKIMFNLDHSIANWRRQMTDAGIKSTSALDELESHLREEVERQMRSGATVEKAFEVAMGRVGEAKALNAEFDKAGRSRGALEKLMIAACVFLVGFITLLSAAAVFLCYSSLGDRIVAATGVVCVLITACYWSRVVPFLPVIQDTSKRNAVALACIVAGFGIGTLFGQTLLSHFAAPFVGQAPAAIIWSLLPVAAGFGLGCGLDQAACRKTARPAS